MTVLSLLLERRNTQSCVLFLSAISFYGLFSGCQKASLGTAFLGCASRLIFAKLYSYLEWVPLTKEYRNFSPSKSI